MQGDIIATVTARLALVLTTAILGCATGGSAPFAEGASQRSCHLFQGVSKNIPAGGVRVGLQIPIDWAEAHYPDGSCRFTPPRGAGIVSASMPFCMEVPDAPPCDAALGGKAFLRSTADYTLGAETMRQTEHLIADPRTRRLVRCAASVQGPGIDEELAAQLVRLEKICDSFTVVASEAPR
jgi:hypothetical protein